MIAAAGSVSLRFHSHPSVVLVVGAVGVFFWWAFTRLGPRLVPAGEPVATRRQKQWIVAGLIWTFVFSEYPIHDISEKYLFFVHMIQHTVFTLVAPACFLMGAPSWLWNWMLDRPVIGPVVRFASRPLLALLTFNLFIAGTHWRNIVERSLHNEAFHFGVHLVMFTGAIFIWIPVINRTDRLPRLAAPTKMIYLFGQSIVPTVPSALLVFSRRATYPTYRNAPRLIKSMTALEDQQLAAAIMKLGAGTLLWGIVVYLFANWWRDSKAGKVSDNRRSAATPDLDAPGSSAPRSIAGMTIDGGRVDDGRALGPVDETLTWEHVQAEFERLDRASGITPAGTD